MRHGSGVYAYPDGARYEGEYVNDERTGRGICYLADGRVDEAPADNNIVPSVLYTYESKMVGSPKRKKENEVRALSPWVVQVKPKIECRVQI